MGVSSVSWYDHVESPVRRSAETAAHLQLCDCLGLPEHEQMHLQSVGNVHSCGNIRVYRDLRGQKYVFGSCSRLREPILTKRTSFESPRASEPAASRLRGQS